MTRGRHENHVHTSPEPSDSDAGPHHEHPTPTPLAGTSARHGQVRQVPGQLTLPDLDLDLDLHLDRKAARPVAPVVPDPQVALAGAVDQLARAMAVSGRERAAHTLLAPYVEQELERTWHAELAATPAAQVPQEHLRHRDDLMDNRGEVKRLTTRAHELSEHVRALHEQVNRLPFWSRGRRTALTEQITHGTTYMTRIMNQDIPAAQHRVTQAAIVVSGDDQDRLDTDVAARAAAERAWRDRPATAYLDPNTLTWPIGTWTGRDRHQPREQQPGNTSHSSNQRPTHSNGERADPCHRAGAPIAKGRKPCHPARPKPQGWGHTRGCSCRSAATKTPRATAARAGRAP